MKNFKTYLIIAISITVLFILIPFLFYIYNFWENEISNSSSDWGTFGDYFGGLLNPIIGIANIAILIIISYQIAGWDNKRHKNEFLYQAYRVLSDKLSGVTIKNLNSEQLYDLEQFLLSFRSNQQFLFEVVEANIIFNERIFGLQSCTLQLKELLGKDESVSNKSEKVDISDLSEELEDYVRTHGKETEVTKKYREFENQKSLLLSFFQRILNNSNYDGYSNSAIIANDGKDRTIAKYIK